MARDEETPLEKQRSKTLKLIEKDQIENSLGKEALDEELEDSVEDVASDESFTEEKEEKIAPLSKAGTSETTREAIDERFSREHEFLAEEKDPRKNVKNKAKSGGGTDDNI